MSGNGLDPEKVRYISLVRKEGGEPILGIPYREMSVDPDLVASFVLAVIIFENRQLRTFTKEGYVVIIEEGTHVVGLLIIDKVEEEAPYRESLKMIINTFEARFNNQLKSWSGDIRPFREFALFIISVFPYRRLNPDYIPILIKESAATPDHRAKIPWAVGESDRKLQTIVGYINGKRTINEIAETTDIEFMEVMGLFSMLDKYKWISLVRPVRADTVLVKVMDPPSLLVGAYGEQLLDIMKMLDGTNTLGQIAEALNIPIEVLVTIARHLVESGIVAFVSDEDG